jgi:hypothetical protein
VPPDVLTGLPLDCCGADDGVWTLLELLELLDLSLCEELPLVELPLVEELLFAGVTVFAAAACVAPGSRSAITPATPALLIPRMAVVTFSRWRPRSRSATARAIAYVASGFARWPRDASLRNSGLLISESLADPVVSAVGFASKNTLDFTAASAPARRGERDRELPS